MISVVTADRSHSSQPIIHNQQHLIVFKELGLMYNPSYVSEAWWRNNAILEESITNYLTSEHRSNTRPLLEDQTSFEHNPSPELSKLEAALFITDPTAKILRSIRLNYQELHQDLKRIRRSLLSGLLAAPLAAFRPTRFDSILQTGPRQTGTLYRLLQLQPFPWIINGVPVAPSQLENQVLAIPINDNSDAFQFDIRQLDQFGFCTTVKSLRLCKVSQLQIKPANESCLLALARQQYKEALTSCTFAPFQPLEVIYPLTPSKFILYSAENQSPVYNCTGNQWRGLNIDSKISLITMHPECDLKISEHQIYATDMLAQRPVMEYLSLSTNLTEQKKPKIQTSTIINFTVFCLLTLLAIASIIKFIISHKRFPTLLTPIH